MGNLNPFSLDINNYIANPTPQTEAFAKELNPFGLSTEFIDGLGDGQEDSITNEQEYLANLRPDQLQLLSNAIKTGQIPEETDLSQVKLNDVSSFWNGPNVFKAELPTGKSFLFSPDFDFGTWYRNYLKGVSSGLGIGLVSTANSAVNLISEVGDIFTEGEEFSWDDIWKTTWDKPIRDFQQEYLKVNIPYSDEYLQNQRALEEEGANLFSDPRFWNNLMSKEFWNNEVIQALSSMAEFVGPGLAVGKIGTVSRVVEKIPKILKLDNASKLVKSTLPATGMIGDAAISSYVMGSMEANLEADHGSERIAVDFYNKKTGDNISDLSQATNPVVLQEAMSVKDQSYNRIFRDNQIPLAIMNMLPVSQLLYGKKIASSLGKWFRDNPLKTTGFSTFVSGTGEGVQEVYQSGVESYEHDRFVNGLYPIDESTWDSIWGSAKRGYNDFNKDVETTNSFVAGFIANGQMQVFGAPGLYKDVKDLRLSQKYMKNARKSDFTSFNDFIAADSLGKEESEDVKRDIIVGKIKTLNEALINDEFINKLVETQEFAGENSGRPELINYAYLQSMSNIVHGALRKRVTPARVRDRLQDFIQGNLKDEITYVDVDGNTITKSDFVSNKMNHVDTLINSYNKVEVISNNLKPIKVGDHIKDALYSAQTGLDYFTKLSEEANTEEKKSQYKSIADKYEKTMEYLLGSAIVEHTEGKSISEIQEEIERKNKEAFENFKNEILPKFGISEKSGEEISKIIEEEVNSAIKQNIGEYALQEDEDVLNTGLKSLDESGNPSIDSDIENSTGDVNKAWKVDHVDKDIKSNVKNKINNEKENIVSRILDKIKSTKIETVSPEDGKTYTYTFSEIFNNLSDERKNEVENYIKQRLDDSMMTSESEILEKYNLRVANLRLKGIDNRVEELKKLRNEVEGYAKGKNLIAISERITSEEEIRRQILEDVERGEKTIEELKEKLGSSALTGIEMKTRGDLLAKQKKLQSQLDAIRKRREKKKRRKDKKLNDALKSLIDRVNEINQEVEAIENTITNLEKEIFELNELYKISEIYTEVYKELLQKLEDGVGTKDQVKEILDKKLDNLVAIDRQISLFKQAKRSLTKYLNSLKKSIGSIVDSISNFFKDIRKEEIPEDTNLSVILENMAKGGYSSEETIKGLNELIVQYGENLKQNVNKLKSELKPKTKTEISKIEDKEEQVLELLKRQIFLNFRDGITNDAQLSANINKFLNLQSEVDVYRSFLQKEKGSGIPKNIQNSLEDHFGKEKELERDYKRVETEIEAIEKLLVDDTLKNYEEKEEEGALYIESFFNSSIAEENSKRSQVIDDISKIEEKIEKLKGSTEEIKETHNIVNNWIKSNSTIFNGKLEKNEPVYIVYNPGRKRDELYSVKIKRDEFLGVITGIELTLVHSDNAPIDELQQEYLITDPIKELNLNNLVNDEVIPFLDPTTIESKATGFYKAIIDIKENNKGESFDNVKNKIINQIEIETGVRIASDGLMIDIAKGFFNYSEDSPLFKKYEKDPLSFFFNGIIVKTRSRNKGDDKEVKKPEVSSDHTRTQREFKKLQSSSPLSFAGVDIHDPKSKLSKKSVDTIKNSFNFLEEEDEKQTIANKVYEKIENENDNNKNYHNWIKAVIEEKKNQEEVDKFLNDLKITYSIDLDAIYMSSSFTEAEKGKREKIYTIVKDENKSEKDKIRELQELLDSGNIPIKLEVDHNGNKYYAYMRDSSFADKKFGERFIMKAKDLSILRDDLLRYSEEYAIDKENKAHKKVSEELKTMHRRLDTVNQDDLKNKESESYKILTKIINDIRNLTTDNLVQSDSNLVDVLNMLSIPYYVQDPLSDTANILLNVTRQNYKEIISKTKEKLIGDYLDDKPSNIEIDFINRGVLDTPDNPTEASIEESNYISYENMKENEKDLQIKEEEKNKFTDNKIDEAEIWVVRDMQQLSRGGKNIKNEESPFLPGSSVIRIKDYSGNFIHTLVKTREFDLDEKNAIKKIIEKAVEKKYSYIYKIKDNEKIEKEILDIGKHSKRGDVSYIDILKLILGTDKVSLVPKMKNGTPQKGKGKEGKEYIIFHDDRIKIGSTVYSIRASDPRQDDFGNLLGVTPEEIREVKGEIQQKESEIREGTKDAKNIDDIVSIFEGSNITSGKPFTEELVKKLNDENNQKQIEGFLDDALENYDDLTLKSKGYYATLLQIFPYYGSKDGKDTYKRHNEKLKSISQKALTFKKETERRFNDRIADAEEVGKKVSVNNFSSVLMSFQSNENYNLLFTNFTFFDEASLRTEEKTKERPKVHTTESLPSIDNFLKSLRLGVNSNLLGKEKVEKNKKTAYIIENLSIKLAGKPLKNKGESYEHFIKRSSKYSVETLNLYAPKLAFKVSNFKPVDPTVPPPKEEPKEPKKPITRKDILNKLEGQPTTQPQAGVSDPPFSAVRADNIREVSDAEIQKDLEWIKNILPQIPLNEVALRKITDNIYALASFVTSAEILDNFGETFGINYSRYTKKNSGRTQIRHEAFEAIWDLYLTPVEKNKYLKAARKKYGEPTKADLKFTRETYPWLTTDQEASDMWHKEQMADDFNEYRYTKNEGGYLRRLFDKLITLINTLLGNRRAIEGLFNRIETRGFANKEVKNRTKKYVEKHSSISTQENYGLEPADIGRIASSVVGNIINYSVDPDNIILKSKPNTKIIDFDDVVSSFVGKLNFTRENVALHYLYSTKEKDLSDIEADKIYNIVNSIRQGVEGTIGDKIYKKTIDTFNTTIGEKLISSEEELDETELEDSTVDGKYDYSSYELNFKDNQTPLVKLILSSIPKADKYNIVSYDSKTLTKDMLPKETATNLVVESIADFYKGEQTLNDWIERLGILSDFRQDIKKLLDIINTLKDNNENIVRQFFISFNLESIRFFNVIVDNNNTRRVQNATMQKKQSLPNKWGYKILHQLVKYDTENKRYVEVPGSRSKLIAARKIINNLEKARKNRVGSSSINKSTSKRISNISSAKVAFKSLFDLFNIEITTNVVDYIHKRLLAEEDKNPTLGEVNNFIDGVINYFDHKESGIFTIASQMVNNTYKGLSFIPQKKEDFEKGLPRKVRQPFSYKSDESAMAILSTAQTLFDVNLIENTVFSDSGLKYTYAMISYFNNVLNKYTDKKSDFAKKRRESLYHRRSLILNAIIEDGFVPEVIDADMMIDLSTKRKVSLNQPFVEEDLIANATLLLRPDGTENSKRYSRLVSFNSHKRNNISISLPKFFDPKYTESDGIQNQEVIDLFSGYFMDEYERMAIEDSEFDRFKRYKSNRKKSYLFPNLSKEITAEEEKNLTSEEKEIRSFLYDSEIRSEEGVREKINDYVKNVLDNLISNKIGLFNKMYTNKSYESDLSILFGPSKESNESLASKLVINGLIGNIESFKLFLGDPAFWKDAVDITKRTHSITSSGPPIDLHTLNYIVKESKELKSNTYTNEELEIRKKIIEEVYKEELEKEGINENELRMNLLKDLEDADDIINNFYNNVDTTDAYAKMTLPYFREIMRMLGRWNPKIHDKIYNDLMRGKYKSSEAETKLLGILQSLQPLKTVQYDLNNNLHPRLAVATYHKWALQVLHPASVGTGELQREYNLMVYGREEVNYEKDNYDELSFDEQIHFIVTDSASKGDHNVDKKLKEINADNYKDAVESISGWSMKLQQDLTAKYWKNPKVIEPSQFRHNVFQNINPTGEYILTSLDGKSIIKKTGEELWNEMNSLDSKISDNKLSDFLSSIDYNYDNGRIGNLENLSNMLKNEVLRKSVPDDIINLLEEYPIDITKSPQYRSLLHSIISKKVRKMIQTKLPGLAAIQAPELDLLNGSKEIDNISGDVIGDSIILLNNFKVDEEGRLKGPHYEYNEETKERRYRPGLIFLPSSAIKLMPKKDRNDAKKVKEFFSDTNVLNVIMARIPNQGASSIDSAKIAGILPDYFGDQVIMYSDVTRKYGSDYDVDKMYVMTYNYTVKNGKLAKVDFYEKSDLKDDKVAKEAYKAYLKENVSKDNFKYVKFLSSDIIESIKALNSITRHEDINNFIDSIKDSINRERKIYEDINLDIRKTTKALWNNFGMTILNLSESSMNSVKELQLEMVENNIKGLEKVERYYKLITDIIELNLNQIKNLNLEEGQKTFESQELENDNIQLNNMLQDLTYILHMSGIKENALSSYKENLSSIKDEKKELISIIDFINNETVASMNDLPNFKEFKDNFNEVTDNSEKAIENRKIDIYKSIIESKYFYTQNTTPLDKYTEIIKPFIKNNMNLKDDSPNVTGENDIYEIGLDLYTLSTQLKIKNINMSGKNGISVGANSGVSLTVFQRAKVTYELYLGDDHTEIDFSKYKNIDGEYLSSIISGALLNAFVDAEKDPYITFSNIVSYTFPTVDILIKTGASTNNILNFMLQPLFLEVLQNRKYSSPLFPSISKKIKGKSFPINEVEITADRMGMFEEFISLHENPESISELFQKWIIDPNGQKKLQRNLNLIYKKDSAEGSLLDAEKIELLVLFNKLLYHGDILSQAITSVKFNVNAAGKNFEQAKKKLEAVRRALGLSKIEFMGKNGDGTINADSWVGKVTMTDENGYSYITEEDIKTFERKTDIKNYTKIFVYEDPKNPGKFRPTSMGKYFANSVVFLDNFMMHDDITQNTSFKNTVSSVSALLGDPFSRNESLTNKIIKDLYAHVVGLQFFEEGFIMDGEKVKFTKEKLKDLFYGDNTAFHSLEKIKYKAPVFYSLLDSFGNIEKKEGDNSPKFIYSDNFQNKSVDAINTAIEELKILYDDPKYKNDINKLFYYSLFLSGFSYDNNSFINLMPSDILINIVNSDWIKNRVNNLSHEDFTSEFVKNRYKDENVVTMVKIKPSEKDKKAKIGDGKWETVWKKGELAIPASGGIINGISSWGRTTNNELTRHTYYPYVSTPETDTSDAKLWNIDRIVSIENEEKEKTAYVIYKESNTKGYSLPVTGSIVSISEWGNLEESIFNNETNTSINFYDSIGGGYPNIAEAVTPIDEFNQRSDKPFLMNKLLNFKTQAEVSPLGLPSIDKTNEKCN